MIPKLYEKVTANTVINKTNYIGVLNKCTKCEVTEVRNGAYTLSLETTVNDDCANMLLSQRIIGAKANPFDGVQYFEIQSTERGTTGIIKVEAKHIKNYCFQYCSEGDLGFDGQTATINGTPSQIWNSLNSEYITTEIPFSFYSDITEKLDFSLGLSTPETLGNILGGKEGSFLDIWGGEYHWNNFNIQLLAERGKRKDFQIRYGSNISDYTQSESCDGTYSHVLPYGKVSLGNRKINFFAPVFEISGHKCSTTKVFMLDCTGFLDNYSVGEQGARYDTVRSAMTKYAKAYAKNNRLGESQITIDVTLRAELDEMSQIGLCDTVKVILDDLGTTATAKITEVTYNTLTERWEKLVVGESRVTVADMILNKGRYIK